MVWARPSCSVVVFPRRAAGFLNLSARRRSLGDLGLRFGALSVLHGNFLVSPKVIYIVNAESKRGRRWRVKVGLPRQDEL